MSGNFPLVFFWGDLFPSSGLKYLSFCLKTLETVLDILLESYAL